MENNEILTAQEVAAYLRMNTMTIYKMAQEGRIPASKILDCWRFQRQEIERWLQERRIAPRVLIADGERSFVNDARDALRRSGAHCTVAQSGQEAMFYLQNNCYTWVFVGINLDDGAEFDFLQILIEEYPNQRVVLMVGPDEWDRLPKNRGRFLTIEKVRHKEAWRHFAQIVTGRVPL